MARAGRNAVGTCGLTLRPYLEGLNISYHLRPEFWGLGMATSLVNGMVALAPLLSLRFDGYYGIVRQQNPASRKVLEKAGFRAAGQVQHGGHPSILLVRVFSPVR